jgi:hypothetical protein
MRWVLLLIAVIGTNAMAGDTDWVVDPDLLDPAIAKAAIEEIWLTSQDYHQAQGKWPEQVSQLIETGYLTLDSFALFQWTFDIDYQNSSTIWATPNPGFVDGEYRAGQMDPIWYKRNCVIYDVHTGQWQGRGAPRPDVYAFTNEEQFEQTKEVREALESIANVLPLYYQEYRRFPRTIQQLEQSHLLQFSPELFTQWEFSLIGDPPVMIEAVSSQDMPGGAGHIVQYGVQNKRFSGYGVKE